VMTERAGGGHWCMPGPRISGRLSFRFVGAMAPRIECLQRQYAPHSVRPLRSQDASCWCMLHRPTNNRTLRMLLVYGRWQLTSDLS